VTTTRRLLVLVAVVGLLTAGIITDHLVGAGRAAAAPSPAPALPALAPDGSLSSTWFCPATTSVDNGLADGRVIIANPTAVALTGTMTIIPSQGAVRDIAVRVKARSRVSVRPGDWVQAPYAGALVQLDGPSGAVEQDIEGALGQSATPCATQASDLWYFAAGSTDRDAQLLLSLLNPFPGDAVVDLSFATDIGRSAPADLQGLIVPRRGVLVIDVGNHVRRRQVVSSTIAVRTGRVVADKIQLRGAGGSTPKGASVTLGTTAAGTHWDFPDGVAATGVDERYEFYNPSDHEADVSVAVILERDSAEPFALTVAPHDRLTLSVNGESRIPHGVAHATSVQSTNGVGIVVERVLTAGPPSAHLGISDLFGAPRPSPSWVFAVGAADSGQDEWLVAYNPGPTPTELSVTALVGGRLLTVQGLQNVSVPPGQRIALRLGDHLSGSELTLVVAARSPVVVERDLYRVGGQGMSAALGVAGP
jgi:hypothetical protein